MPAGAAHQQTVSSRRRPAIAGMPAFVTAAALFGFLVNKDPQAVEVYTVLIDTATDGETYGLNLTAPEVGSVTFVAGTGTTVALIAAGLAAAWNADPVCRTYAAATVSTATITLTGVAPAVAITVAEDENAAKMTTTNTVDAAAAATVPVGRAMVSPSYQSNEPDALGILAQSSKLTPQVDTVVVTFAAGDIYTIGIEIDGDRYEVNVAANTDSATTATDLATALNAMMPTTTVDVTRSTATLTLTAELAGKPFITTLGLKSGTAARLVLTHTTATPQTDFDKVFAGISIYPYDFAQPAIDTESNAYPANSGIKTIKQGNVWVESTEDVVDGAAVYVELDGSGSNAGKFYTTGGATRKKVSQRLLNWRRSDHGASGAWSASDGDVAMLAVNVGP